MLVACAPMEPIESPAPRPENRPALPAEPIPALDPGLVAGFAATEASLVTQGLLRTDDGDAIDDPARLTQSFLRIALFDEYSEIGGVIVARERSSNLRRWDAPVRIRLTFGASVTPEFRSTDSETVEELARRLSSVSGHPIGVEARESNFDVFVVSEGERRALGPALQQTVPGITEPVLAQIIDMPEAIFCLVVAFSDPAMPAVYQKAVAVIRAELPPLLRRSCYHEELAQGLGLANDSPEARPSLFNDDKEFAFLTGQDELMLAILYDPRLRPGMDLDEARPIVETIARELLTDRRARARPVPIPVPQET